VVGPVFRSFLLLGLFLSSFACAGVFFLRSVGMACSSFFFFLAALFLSGGARGVRGFCCFDSGIYCSSPGFWVVFCHRFLMFNFSVLFHYTKIGIFFSLLLWGQA
jgi:hypothetical protein